jgi:NADH-quinone oxidoreductase subunit C
MKALDPIELGRLTLKDAVLEVVEFRGETTIVIRPDQIAEACRFYRDTEGLEYTLLTGITGLDYMPQEPRFAVAYHLYSFQYNRRLRLKVYLPEDAPEVESVTSIFPAADWDERETFDMFGIIFTGHPKLRRVLMPDEWEGFPLRKDYPLGYEQVQFSFNHTDIDRLKPYAKE